MKRRRKIKRTGAPRPMAAAAIPVPVAVAAIPAPSPPPPAPEPEEAPEDTQAPPAEEEPQEEETHPEEDADEEEQEGSEAESQEETSAPEIHGDIRFPLVSSHLQDGQVRTTGVLVSDHGCGLLHCNAMPRTLNVGVERAAPRIAGIHRAMLRKLGQAETQRKVAEAFCKRAREGDQNAMAMIALVRDNAKRRIPQAVSAFNFMQNFVKTNPVQPGSSFGAEQTVCVRPDMGGAILLANGPSLSNPRIRKVAASFGAEARGVLLEGLRKWQAQHDDIHTQLAERLDLIKRDILKMGRTIGKARALQALRANGPIAAYNSKVAWELGE